MSKPDRRWQRMWQLFHEARALPPEQRTDFLVRTAGDDTDLRDEICDLLVNADADPDFLSKSPSLDQVAFEAASDLLGKTIGPYRITRMIGEGGMGLVYEAEQDAPIRRQVAIKLIRPGMDTRDLLARFSAERQALALMQHQNIAQVYDAGVTDTGRPYFVMELVDGVALDEYCDRHRLDLTERLELFQSACDAVQHAHQKGVLHRDLKPSNILVTGEGATASVKIIDFGIAKALSGQLTPDAVETVVHGLVVGTPDYTAPEIRRSSGNDVDTASDVYSLGIVLYKLLTGELPQKRSGLTETNDTIVDPALQQDAVVPSQILNEIGPKISQAAANRSVTPAQLRKTIRGELDWLVAKAIEPERERRYPTADVLASDVGRFLRGEVLVAGPPGNLYKLRKFVRRNKLAVAFSAALAVAIVVGGLSASIGWVRAVDAEREASVEATRAQAVARFLTDMLEASGPLVARGRDTELLRELAETAVADLEGGESPHWFVEAEVRQALGTLFMQLGDYEKAADHLDRALALAREGFGEATPQTADLWYLIGERANLTGDFKSSESHFAKAVNLHEAQLAAHPAQTPVGKYYAESHSGLAEVLIRYERFDEALEHAMRGLELARAHANEEMTENLNMVARVYLYREEFDQARHYYEESLRIARQGDAQDWQLGMALGHYGVLLRLQRDFEASERAFRESLSIFEVIAGPVHERTAAALNSLAVTISDAGKSAEATSIYRRVLEIQIELLGENHASVADTHFNMAVNYRRLGEYDSSLDHFIRSIDGYLHQFPRNHSYVMESEVLVGEVKIDAADYAGAENWLRKFLQRHDGERPTPSEWVLKGRVALANALAAQERFGEGKLILLDILDDLDGFEISDPDEVRRSALQQLLTLADATEDTLSADRYRQQLDSLGTPENPNQSGLTK